MSTTSTYAVVKAQIVTLAAAALDSDVKVSYAWPGADAAPKAFYLGRHPEFIANPLAASNTIRSEIAAIKTGRKSRNEEYDIEGTIWSFRPDLTVEGTATAEADGFAVLAVLEDIFAADPQLGLGTVLKAAWIADVGVAVVPFEKGWASVLIPTFTVQARLT